MFFFFQAEDGIRDLVRSRGLGDVYKRQITMRSTSAAARSEKKVPRSLKSVAKLKILRRNASIAGLRSTLSSNTRSCLLYTSDAADERSSVDLGGRRIIKKKKQQGEAGKLVSEESSQRIKMLQPDTRERAHRTTIIQAIRIAITTEEPLAETKTRVALY